MLTCDPVSDRLYKLFQAYLPENLWQDKNIPHYFAAAKWNSPYWNAANRPGHRQRFSAILRRHARDEEITMRTEGQAALVTGGGSGLGAATAAALAKDGAGKAAHDHDQNANTTDGD